MRKFVVFLIVILIATIPSFAQESYETAVPIVHKTSKDINLASATIYSYTKTLIPADGTIKVYIQGKHTGGSQGGMSFYSYDKSRRNIFSENFATGLKNGDNFRDTMIIYSRAADSLYFLFYKPGDRSFDLTVTYEVVDQSQNDKEPNDTRPLAVNFNPSQKPEGHIGYIKDGATDHYDYYKTLIPDNGTVQVYFEAKHTGGSQGSLGFYVYDKTGRNIYSNSSLGSKPAEYGETIRDTLNIFSRNSDTLYMLVYQAGGRSFQYKFNYAVIEQSPTDQEPNDTYIRANSIAMGQVREGQIGYITNGVTDHYDYYKTMLPGDGTVRIYIEGQNTGGSQGSFGIYAYDKSRRNILSHSVIGKAVSVGQTTKDTLEIVSREADSIYLVIYNAGGRSINYSFSYEMIDQSINDEEPNNTKQQAAVIKENQNILGHIGYEADGRTDHYDYYKTILPDDGTIEVIIEAVHTGGSQGTLGFYMDDITGRNIFSNASVGKAVSRGGIIRDTLLLHSRQADSIYFYVYQAGGRSFSYTFSYRMINKSTNDVEPNNTKQQAINIAENQKIIGHIGYEADGRTDHHDFYKTVLPEDGTIEVILEAVHTGGSAGTLGFYMEDKTGRNIFSNSSMGTPVSLGGIVRDTLLLHSRESDTLYFYVYQAGGRSFSYNFSYRMIDKSPTDEEPNDIHQQALNLQEKQTVVGHLGYIADGSTDHYDHYRTVLPVDGTVRIIVNAVHTGGSQGSFGLYAYDKSRRNILSESVLGQPVSIYGKISDTAYIFSRADDTLYINVYAAGGRSVQYSMSYEMIDTSLNDQGNESYFTATEMYSDQTVRGHIGYVDDGQTDHYDYYKTLLPVDGTVTIYIEGLHTGGSNGSFGFYAYDKQRRQISGNSTLGNGTISMGMTLKDTIRIDSRAADSIYLVVYNAGGRSFSYTLRYDMPGSLKGDPEPNNTFVQAVSFNITDTLRGLIGYIQSGATDHNDYYKASVPDKSTLKVYIEGEHTGGSNGTFAIYAYDKNRRLLTSKTNLGNGQFSVGQKLLDTITVACNPTDSVYILIYQAGGRSFSYSVRFDHIDNKPNAKFSYTRTANDFGFVNESKNTNSFTWNFGNGTTSSVAMPMVNFKPGVYDVRLIANNSTCNFKDTMIKRITITGIEYFTPTKGGKGGDLNMQIFGGGLDTSARITLKKGGISIPAQEKYDNGAGSMLGMVFDLHFVESGKYDLEVAFKNGDVIKYDTAFTIDAMIYPDTYSEIVGPSVWRTGRTGNFNLVVGNNGNTVARGVIVALVWPKTANLAFYGKQYSPDPKEFMVAEMEEYNETIKSSYSLVKWIYDSINTVTPIDTFKTEPYDGYVRFLYVPVIAPNSTYELPFTITTDASTKHRLITYTVKPNQYGSCETYNISSAFTSPAAVELMINTLDWGVDELKVPKATKIPAQVAVKTLKVTQKHIDVSSNVLAHRMWASYYNWTSGGGGENHGLTDSEYYDYYKEGLAADEFAKNQLQDIAIDQGINLLQLPAGARKNKLTDQIHDNNQALLNKANDYHKIAGKKTGRSKTWRMKKKEAAREWQKQFESGQVTIADLTELENLESIAEWAGRTKNAKGELEALLKYIEENCPEHKEALDKLKEELNKEKDINKEKEKETETRTSYDPNAIYGPSGFNQAGYVNTFDRHPFVIMFENVDTAKADAQIVKITDTIDKSKFDLSTFELGNITIGGKWYKLPKGRKEIMMEIDLTAERNMHVRLNASLDTATGIATWLLTSINPRTGDVPDFDGFLPPNKDYPSGEGSVTFSIYPHKNLAHGTRLESQASIVFDFNEPILTNTWLNTIDAKKPTGNIQAEILEDSNIVITYNATDTESGVNYYNIYISEDNKVWVPIGGGNSTSQILPAESGKTYYFYVESEDRVGNIEEKSAVGEATVKVPEYEQATAPASTLIVYPIPTNGRLTMEFDVPVEQRISATVFSPSGVLVAEVYNAQVSGAVRTTTNLSHLANGIYFVRVRGDKGLNLYKKIVIMK